MSEKRMLLSRREFMQVVPLGVAGAIILTPEEAEAGWFGVAFRAMAWSFGTVVGGALATGIMVTGTTVLAAYGAYSIFRDLTSSSSGSSRSSYGGSGGYYASYSPDGWKPVVPRVPVMVAVSFDSKKHIRGDILRLRAIRHNILKDDGIMIANKGRLIIEENGRLVFADTKFKGHAFMQQSGDLSVWTSEDKHVLTRTVHNKIFHNFSHDSENGRLAVASLLGDVKHA